MVKNAVNTKWNTIRYLQDPQKTKVPRNYKLVARSTNGNTLHASLWNGNKQAANINIRLEQNINTIMANFEGQTNPNYRGRNLATLLRGLVTKALLMSGVNRITHYGINVNNIAAKALAKKKGISIEKAKVNKNFAPLSTRIVRKLGYAPNNNVYYMTPTMNMTKLNNIVKKIAAAISIQRAYRKRLAARRTSS